MNCSAIWVAPTAVGITVPIVVAQAMASPLPEITAGGGFDADIAAPPLIATDLILGLEGMARGVLVQRARSVLAIEAPTVHPVAAAMIPEFITPTVLFRCRRVLGIDKSSRA